MVAGQGAREGAPAGDLMSASASSFAEGDERTFGAFLEGAVRAAFAQIVVRALVREELPERSLPALLRTLTPRHRPPRFGHVPDDVARVIRAVDAVVQRTPIGAGTCLFRALARYAALRQAKVDVDLCIGVAPDAGVDGDFVAHAWLEVAGRPVFEQGEGMAHLATARYSVIYRFPEPAP